MPGPGYDRLQPGGGGGGGDELNFPHVQEPGVEFGTSLDIITGEMSPGLSTSQSDYDVVVRQDPTFEITQVKYDLAHLSYVTTATESVGSDWDNVPASRFPPDGSLSVLSEGLALTQGTLIGQFAGQAGRESLSNPTNVTLSCYFRIANVLLPGTTLQISYQFGDLGTPTVLETFSGNGLSVTNVDHLTTPRQYNIGTVTWANLSTIQVRYAGTILVDAGLTQVAVDATGLSFTATLTENL